MSKYLRMKRTYHDHPWELWELSQTISSTSKSDNHTVMLKVVSKIIKAEAVLGAEGSMMKYVLGLSEDLTMASSSRAVNSVR